MWVGMALSLVGLPLDRAPRPSEGQWGSGAAGR